MVADIRQMASFVGGVALGEDEVLLLGVFDDQKDEPHSIVLHRAGEKQAAKGLDWSSRAICRSPLIGGDVLVAGLEGELASWRKGALTPLSTLPVRERPKPGGAILQAREIAGIPHLVGYGRQVWRRTGPDAFELLDAGLPAPAEGKVEVSAFEAIDGFAPDELYACGRSGEIWRFDGATWHAVDSPTNLRLMGICCAPDGHVYACGQFGMLLRGRGETWEVIHADEGIRYFWDLAWLDGALLLASSHVLYRWDGEELAPFPFPDLPPQEGMMPKSFLRFSTLDGAVWSIGDKDVAVLHADRWRRVI